ncbi:MAG: hypothetical protein AABY83_13505 [Pseudomonadota bacterium]
MNGDFGGTKMASFTYSDGSTAELHGGALFTFAGGTKFAVNDLPLVIETTAGYKFDKVNGANGSASFSRIPLDVVALFSHSMLRAGGGITYHLNPSFTCDIASICGGSVKFSNALGVVAQLGIELPIGKKSFDLGARYTSINYKPNSAGVSNVDGSAIGFYFGSTF